MNSYYLSSVPLYCCLLITSDRSCLSSFTSSLAVCLQYASVPVLANAKNHAIGENIFKQSSQLQNENSLQISIRRFDDDSAINCFDLYMSPCTSIRHTEAAAQLPKHHESYKRRYDINRGWKYKGRLSVISENITTPWKCKRKVRTSLSREKERKLEIQVAPTQVQLSCQHPS